MPKVVLCSSAPTTTYHYVCQSAPSCFFGKTGSEHDIFRKKKKEPVCPAECRKLCCARQIQQQPTIMCVKVPLVAFFGKQGLSTTFLVEKERTSVPGKCRKLCCARQLQQQPTIMCVKVPLVAFLENRV